MKVAILGMGFMGQKHKTMLKKIPSVDIVAEIDSQNRSEEAFASLEDFYSKNIVADLVVIATPNHLHFQNAIDLLEKGYDVLLEKPFCFNTNQLQEIENASKKFNKKVFIVMQNRFSSVSIFLKKIIADGKLGKIYNLQFNAFWNRGENYYQKDSWKGKKEQDGGILYTQFSHLLDLLIFILNEKLSIHYKDLKSFRNKEICEIEDSVIAVVESEKGTKIVLNFSNAVYKNNQETSLNIIGEKGTLKISGQYFNEIVYQNIEGIEEKISLEDSSNESNLLNLYKEIFKNLENKDNNALLIRDGAPLIEFISQFYS